MNRPEIGLAIQNLDRRIVRPFDSMGGEKAEFAKRLGFMLPMLEMACDGAAIRAPSKYVVYRERVNTPRDFEEMAGRVRNNATDYRVHSWLANARNFYQNGKLVGRLDYPYNLRVTNQHIGDTQGDPELTLQILNSLRDANEVMLLQVLENWHNIGAHASVMRDARNLRRKIERLPVERLVLRLEGVYDEKYREAISGAGGIFPIMALGFTWLLGGGVEMEGINYDYGKGKYVMSEEPVAQRAMEQLGWQNLPTLLRDAEARANS